MYSEKCIKAVLLMGNLFTTAGRKRVVIFVVGRTNNSSKGTHNINLFYFIFFCLWGPDGLHKNLPTPVLRCWATQGRLSYNFYKVK